MLHAQNDSSSAFHSFCSRSEPCRSDRFVSRPLYDEKHEPTYQKTSYRRIRIRFPSWTLLSPLVSASLREPLVVSARARESVGFPAFGSRESKKSEKKKAVGLVRTRELGVDNHVVCRDESGAASHRAIADEGAKRGGGVLCRRRGFLRTRQRVRAGAGRWVRLVVP